MRALLFHELKRLWKNPVPWILLLVTLTGAVLSWQSLAGHESLAEKSVSDPMARYNLHLIESPEEEAWERDMRDIEKALEDPDLSEMERQILLEQLRVLVDLLHGGYIEDWFRMSYFLLHDENETGLIPRPEHMEEFQEMKELIALARDENMRNEVFPYLEHGLDFSAYTLRLFRFSQSGFLILSALILGAMSARFQEGPLFRRLGSGRILLYRISALCLTALAALILPRIIASLIMAYQNGWGNIDLTIPFNPGMGSPLFYGTGQPGTALERTVYSSIRADFLIGLGPAYVLMYAYEAAQLFLWLSIGLLAGSLTRRSFLSLGIPMALALLAGNMAPLIRGQLAGLLFPAYQDAVRDVMGSSLMMRGVMIRETPPQDYMTGLAAMVIWGLAALYLTDLRQKSLHRSVRKGDADETL